MKEQRMSIYESINVRCIGVDLSLVFMQNRPLRHHYNIKEMCYKQH